MYYIEGSVLSVISGIHGGGLECIPMDKDDGGGLLYVCMFYCSYAQ